MRWEEFLCSSLWQRSWNNEILFLHFIMLGFVFNCDRMKQTLEKVLLPVQWMVQRVVGIIHLLSVATVVWMTCASVDVGIQTENWMKHQWPSRTPWATAGSSIFRPQKDFFTATFCGFHLFALPVCVIPPYLFLPHIFMKCHQRERYNSLEFPSFVHNLSRDFLKSLGMIS